MNPQKIAKCKVCKTKYERRSAWQKVCGAECAAVFAAKEKSVKIAKAAREEKANDRAKLAAMQAKPQLEKELKAALHAYIRDRDYGLPCISCNEPIAWGTGATGGVCDAGHYLSVGAHANLKFEELNINAQCKHCNNFLAGNPARYRAGLIKKIGLERVEALESDNTPRKYSKDELRAMTKLYKAKTANLRIST